MSDNARMKLNPLTRARMRAKVSQEDLALKTKELAEAAGMGEKGVSPSTINFIERGRHKGRHTTISRLVDALNAIYTTKNITENGQPLLISIDDLIEIMDLKAPLNSETQEGAKSGEKAIKNSQEQVNSHE